jgi:hypothetical protein
VKIIEFGIPDEAIQAPVVLAVYLVPTKTTEMRECVGTDIVETSDIEVHATLRVGSLDSFPPETLLQFYGVMSRALEAAVKDAKRQQA